MKRRNFIQLAAIATGTVVAGVALYPSFEKSIKRIIKEDTQGLKIKEEEIDKFIAEARQERFWEEYKGVKKEVIRVHSIVDVGLPYREKYNDYRSKITTAFLLSTDFFNNKMDANKDISYMSFYNPYKRPCANPFSNLYYRSA